MTQTLFVPVSMKSADLLSSMNEKNIHMAVVLDEYGGAVGIVTKEDLLEEIVGEIEDEFDEAIKYYEKRGEGRFIVDSAMELSAVKDELGIDLPSGDYETISGFINSAMESIPKEKTKIAVGDYLLTVLKATERKATSVLIVDVTLKENSVEAEKGPENNESDR
jgi:putative hemolysin